MRQNSPQGKRSTRVLFAQPDGAMICGSCRKDRTPQSCLCWNTATQTLDYRMRPVNEHERVITTSHPEISAPVRVVVEQAEIHGLGLWILAEKQICAAGWLLVTGLPSAYLRANGSRLAGRLGRLSDCDRCRGRSSRGAPTPLKFLTLSVYDAMIRGTEPIPEDSVSFLHLVAILARRVKQGEPFTAVIQAYRDHLEHFLSIEGINLAPERVSLIEGGGDA